MRRLPELYHGQQLNNKMYNEVVSRVNALSNITGRNGVAVRPTNNGVSITGTTATASDFIRKSFVKDPPGVTSAVVVYLDRDSASATSASPAVVPGLEVTVQCELIGTSALNAAIPRLEAGVMLPIWDNSGVWRPFFPFQGTGDCP